MPFYGRREILTDRDIITKGNVVEVLQAALEVHAQNRSEIDYLWRYYKGEQPILNRTKKVRPEICNKIVENHAREIVDFKVGYLLGEPIQYVARVDGDEAADEIGKLNSYATAEEKEGKDIEVCEWMHVCGLGYKMVLPDTEYRRGDADEAPYEDFVLDPRNTFVVRFNDLGHPVVMSVKYVTKADGAVVYDCYTEDTYYKISSNPESGDVFEIIDAKDNRALGIPIVEYRLNSTRQGAFEPVILLLDAINNVESNRMDGIEQFIQALLLFHNVTITPEEFEQLRAEGGLMVADRDPSMKGEVRYLVQELNQGQTQVAKDDIYEQVLLICGMPNRNGGSSTSDTGAAVEMRDGWSAAETRAKRTETAFKSAEREYLKKVVRICDELDSLKLRMSAIEIRFTRRNYENISQKASVLTTMLGCDKIAPQLAFSHCGMFADPDLAWKLSEKYVKEAERNAKNQNAVDTGSSDGGERDPVEGQPRGNRPEEGQAGRLGAEQQDPVRNRS